MYNFDRVKEKIRYDYNQAKLLILPFLLVANWHKRRGKPIDYLNFLSKMFRLNWPGTYKMSLDGINNKFIDKRTRRLHRERFDEMLCNIKGLEQYKQFIEHPEQMLDGIVTVISPHNGKCKGVVVIAYSYYFLIFLKMFDVKEIEKNYHIVLEPSWNGLCDEAILSFAYLKNPVFVMAYEDRDFNFLVDLRTNLTPLKISANWWIDPETFNHGVSQNERDIDIIMIAAWAKFKRHDSFFKALKTLKKRGKNYNVTLIGYPNDLTKHDIESMADRYGIKDMLTFYEWISPKEVSELLGRAKVNIVWSRFEGLNRAIIEGMFCDTPCILRKGFNFGMEYPYINEVTGRYSTERDLPEKLQFIIENPHNFTPRDYIRNHQNCYIATEILTSLIAKHDEAFDVSLARPKASELNGMRYINAEDKRIMEADYIYLESTIGDIHRY